MKILYILFLFLIFVRPVLLVYEQRDKFFLPGFHNQYESLRSVYGSSQYMQKKNPGIIPDETLTMFIGGIFLKGINPILVVHDHPPLGRYIISLSIFLFDNPHTIIIFLSLLSILGVFLIARSVLSNIFVSLIPVGIFINEPLFLGKFTYSPVLESIQLPFIIFALYFFIKVVTSKKYIVWCIFTSLSLGFVISTRFFILGAAELSSMILYFLLQRRIDKKIIAFFLSLPLSLLVLVLSYIKTIEAGYSIMQVFSIQKYIYFYHQSKFIIPFSYWDLLLFNRWHTWWGDGAIITDPQWIVAWPIFTFLTAALVVAVILKKITVGVSEKVLLLWIFSYSVLLSIGTTTTRYFLPLLPFLYILGFDFIVRIWERYIYDRKA